MNPRLLGPKPSAMNRTSLPPVKTKDKSPEFYKYAISGLKVLIYYTSLFRAVKDFAESSKNYRLTAAKVS